jgi:hypothetical protein
VISRSFKVLQGLQNETSTIVEEGYILGFRGSETEFDTRCNLVIKGISRDGWTIMNALIDEQWKN